MAFRYDLLKKMAVEPLSLQTVFYRDDVGEHELVEIIYRLIRRHKAPWDTSPAIRTALNHAWAASAAFKHPSFQSEKEVRLAAAANAKRF